MQDEKVCFDCFKMLTMDAVDVDDPMKPIFENIEGLKRQLLEILPYFNGLLVEINSTKDAEQKELHKQASVLRLQLAAVLEGIQKSIYYLQQIPANGEYKKCIDNYIKSIHTFMQSFTSTMRTFK